MKRLFAFCLALMMSSCASAPKLTGSAATDFYLTDQSGKIWNSQAMRDETLLLDFWATWCVPCIQGIPDLNAFNEKYGAKIKLLGIAIEEKGWDVVKPSIEKHGLSYAVAIGQENLAKAFQVEGFPTMILIRKGKVIRQLTGKHSLTELEAELAEDLR